MRKNVCGASSLPEAVFILRPPSITCNGAADGDVVAAVGRTAGATVGGSVTGGSFGAVDDNGASVVDSVSPVGVGVGEDVGELVLLRRAVGTGFGAGVGAIGAGVGRGVGGVGTW